VLSLADTNLPDLCLAVIAGKRPSMPSNCPAMMVDLINRCWHQDPRMRPTFEQIIEEKVLTRGTLPISLKGMYRIS